jgi:hypothetical protein
MSKYPQTKVLKAIRDNNPIRYQNKLESCVHSALIAHEADILHEMGAARFASLNAKQQQIFTRKLIERM